MTGHRAVLVDVDGTVTAESFDTINLDTLTTELDVRYVDCVQVRTLGGDSTLDAWVDDEGLINGSSPNPVASQMISMLAGSDCQLLHGRVMFVTCDSATGESLGLSAEHQKRLVGLGELLAGLIGV